MKSALTKHLASITIAAVMFALFPVPLRAQQPGGDSAQPDRGCNAVGAAVVGALIGGLLGGKNNKDRTKGAAVGAGIATLACVAFNYNSRQVKTAEQVKSEYQQKNQVTEPEVTSLVRYESRFEPSERVRAGTSTKLVSYIEVVQGSRSPTPVIEEEITVRSPKGQELKKSRKPANQDGGAGAFQTAFALTLPQGVEQGVYSFESSLFIDGKQAASSDAKLQVVLVDSPERYASSHVPATAP
jgi:hypothetical protein